MPDMALAAGPADSIGMATGIAVIIQIMAPAISA